MIFIYYIYIQIRETSSGILCWKKKYTIEEIKINLENDEKELNKNINNLELNKDNFKYWTKSCFVVFNTISDYEKFYSYFPNNWYEYIIFNIKKLCGCFRNKENKKEKSIAWINSFDVSKAPEPEDIIWENFIYKKRNRYCRRMLTLFIEILLTGLNLGVVLGLNYSDVRNYLIFLLIFSQLILQINQK